MSFDLAAFERAEFTPRKGSVPVPALATFFHEGAEPVWEVRSLTAAELHVALEDGARQKSVESVVQALTDKKDQVEAVRRALGLTKGAPGEISKRISMLVQGSVNPVLTRPLAVKLAERFPIEFMLITNEISSLTGQGAELVKPAAASQETTDSTPA